MTPKELRIGNFVKLFLNHEDYEIIEVTSKDLQYIEKNQGIYEPILLNQEWLYDFGFTYIDIGGNDYITYTDPNHDYYLQIDVRKKDNKYTIINNSINELVAFSMVDINHVHQLQNLYYGLTGEDLKIQGGNK